MEAALARRQQPPESEQNASDNFRLKGGLGTREVCTCSEGCWVGLMEGFYISVFGDRTENRHEMALESVSRGNFGRFMKRFLSRGRW